MESEEMVLMNLISGQQWRTDLLTRWEERREKGRCMERVTQKFTIPCVKQIVSGNLLYDPGYSNRGSATG